MAPKDNIAALAFVLVLALLSLLADAGVENPQDVVIWGVEASTEKGHYPEGCIRKDPCPADTGAECDYHRIPKLPCSCSEVKRCDPHASGCRESTIAGLRSCNF